MAWTKRKARREDTATLPTEPQDPVDLRKARNKAKARRRALGGGR